MSKGKVHLKAKQFNRKFACGRIRGIAYVGGDIQNLSQGLSLCTL